jgi:type VI secretion system protein ImpK
MLEKTYWVCADVLTFASQLATAPDLPPYESLRRRVEGLFEAMSAKGQAAGIDAADIADARYALVAFVDEQISRSRWSGRQQWMAQPLQLHYFKSNTLGEGFFNKMEQLAREPQRLHVFEIYYMCLTLGFKGAYALHDEGEALGAMIQRASAMLARGLPAIERMSPHGLPDRDVRTARRAALPVVALSLACLAVALVVFAGLRFEAGGRARDVVKTLDQQSAEPAPAH